MLFAVNRNTFHPKSWASLYFSQSPVNPEMVVCRDLRLKIPSYSKAIILSGMAKSNRHLRFGWNRCSGMHLGIDLMTWMNACLYLSGKTGF